MRQARIPGYGILGFLLIIIAYFFLVLDFRKSGVYYFPLVWIGYVLFVDGLVYRFKGNSLAKNNTSNFFGMFVASAIIWWFFELIRGPLIGFPYTALHKFNDVEYYLLSTIVSSSILPAFLETTNLISCLTTFTYKKKKAELKKEFIWFLIMAGAALILIPIFMKNWTYPLIWIGAFLLFDSLNYLIKEVSIIRNLVKGDVDVLIALGISGIICGFFWIFWNNWSLMKWENSVAFFDFYRLFEVSWITYFFYPFVSWGFFAIYYTLKFLWKSYLKKIIDFIKNLLS